MNHIIIVGFMGSGKTRVGRNLAENLGYAFVDVDKKIVKDMKMSISDIMDRFGDPFYRALETKILKEMLEEETPTVLSVSSGLPIQQQNRRYLKELGIIVYLKASVETLRERLSGDNKRPALKGLNLTDKIAGMLAERAPVYEELADITVITGEVTFHELMKEIEEKVSQKIGKLENSEKNS